MDLKHSRFFDKLEKIIKQEKSFTLSGLTSFSRLLLVKNILEISNKKVLFITSTEQNALKYSTDFSRLFGLDSDILPYQNTSPYDTLNMNLYDYQKQISVLQAQNNLIIAPIKVFSEKFPTLTFFEENKLDLKIGD